MLEPTPKEKWDAYIQRAIKLLQDAGYKVTASRIHGHYESRGDYWPQQGVRIDVFPR